MTGYVYVLGPDTAELYRTYGGWTLDLDRRLAEHNAGGRSCAKLTRGSVWTIIYAECLPTRRKAMSRECHLKRDFRLRRRLAQTAQGKGN